MVILITGVSGSGKTTVGRRLATELNWQFEDADDFHPPENIEKMRKGIPLTDRDRSPWLQALQIQIHHWLTTHTNGVVACSALKTDYRNFLSLHSQQVKFVYLSGSFNLIHQRLSQRQGHYMKAELLASQFEILEEPQDALQVDSVQSPEAIVQQIIQDLGLV
jgi:gluconokinase